MARLSVLLLLLAGPALADDFTGIKRPAWDWKAAGLTYAGIIGADYTLTQRCLAAGTCVESNPRVMTPRARLGASGAMFAVAMASDWLAFRFVHPRAVYALRLGLLGHRVQAHLDVSF